MHGNAVRTGFYNGLSGLEYGRDSDVALVAQQRNFIQIYA
jgi:hypothetical protein